MAYTRKTKLTTLDSLRAIGHTLLWVSIPRVVDMSLVNTIFQKNLVGPSCFISTAKFALEIKKKLYNFSLFYLYSFKWVSKVAPWVIWCLSQSGL